MIVLEYGRVEPVSAPPLVPGDRPIDLDHLSRMTFGENGLESEVLRLFEQQTDMLMRRMGDAEPALVAASAHTLKGSARGIGAWNVAEAADAVERAAAANLPALEAALRTLSVRVAEARGAIAEHLGAH